MGASRHLTELDMVDNIDDKKKGAVASRSHESSPSRIFLLCCTEYGKDEIHGYSSTEGTETVLRR